MKRTAAGLFFLLFVAAASAQSAINIANIKIRVERPDRIRNPQAPGSSNCYDGKDNIFNEIEITPRDVLRVYGKRFEDHDNSIHMLCQRRTAVWHGINRGRIVRSHHISQQ
jgi:hypothetical protein